MQNKLKLNKIKHVYYNMVARCTNPSHQVYHHYGGRGISVCDEWLLSRDLFVEWALGDGGYDFGLELDRLDNNLGYSPANCKFVSKRANSINKRIKSNNSSGYIGVTIDSGNKSKQYRSECDNKFLGYYDTAEHAAKTRDAYIIVNFPGENFTFNDVITYESLYNVRSNFCVGESGVIGASKKDNGKFVCNINVGGKILYLGIYNDILMAGKTYDAYCIVNKLDKPLNNLKTYEYLRNKSIHTAIKRLRSRREKRVQKLDPDTLEVICEYDNMSSAGVSNITRAIKHDRTSGGFRWRYA